MQNNLTSKKDARVPRELDPFIKCPRLLPGESEKDYYALFDLMVEEICPEEASEWLVAADIVGLFWEIARYRAWKGAILNLNRRQALVTALWDTHPSRLPTQPSPVIVARANTEADECYANPEFRRALEPRLAQRGYDEEAINAGAFLEAIEPLSKIDRFLASARGQLQVMLKQVYVRREFANRARKALNDRLDAAAAKVPQPKQIGPN
ncbi:hypothetical protein [Bradyrhizobium genosp. P]|uniref:hypothetical protein n=1 Tax=Bradyrhizobium genosp. P TaxID=83641 RepID=UPI003CEE48CD